MQFGFKVHFTDILIFSMMATPTGCEAEIIDVENAMSSELKFNSGLLYTSSF